VAGDAQASALVGGSHEPNQQLGTGIVERSKAQLIDQNQVVAQQLADQFAHRVVGQPAVQRLEQLADGEHHDLMTYVDSVCALVRGVRASGSRRIGRARRSQGSCQTDHRREQEEPSEPGRKDQRSIDLTPLTGRGQARSADTNRFNDEEDGPPHCCGQPTPERCIRSGKSPGCKGNDAD
jgi:hypothetical protein